MFNYKNWKFYYPGIAFPEPPEPEEPSADPVVDENGNSITPDSLKKNMTIPPEEPANDLAKLLANMLGADPANKVEAASELIKYLDPISKLAIPDYSNATTGAKLTVVESEGPEVTILDEDIGPDELVEINPSMEYSYDLETPISLVVGKKYFLKINGDKEPRGAICVADNDIMPVVTFNGGLASRYMFRTNSMTVRNPSQLGGSFIKSHFTLTTPSVIKKLEWRRENEDAGDVSK